MSPCPATSGAYGPPGGGLARVGRARLRGALTSPAPVPQDGGCGCTRCLPPEPLDDLDAQRAVRHVPAADAVAYARGEVELVGCQDRQSCGGWMPTFV